MEETRKMSSATHATAMAKSEGSKPAMEPASARRSRASPAITRSVRAIQAPISRLRHLSRASLPQGQLPHNTLALRVRHGRPAGNLIKRPAAAGTKLGAGIDHTYADARCLDEPLDLRRAVENTPRRWRHCRKRRGAWQSVSAQHCGFLATREGRGRPAMALLAGWRQGAHDPTFGQINNGLRALAQLRAQLERASV